MHLEKLGQWLTLVANVGVLIGLIVVVVELQQTQNSLAATGHSARTDRNMAIAVFSAEQNMGEIVRKYNQGDEISNSEMDKLINLNRLIARHFEDLHYQYQLGIIDEETWQSNLIGIRNLVNRPSFDVSFNFEETGLRQSFKDLMESLKE